MILTQEDINKLMKTPHCAADKGRAHEAQKYHCLHVSGKGYIEWWLKRSENLESENAFNLKKILARPTTPRITEGLKKQFFKIFRAKGFVRNYRFKNDDDTKRKKLEEALEDVCEGMSLQSFMQSVWFNAMFEDFNGFIGIELKAEDEIGENEPTTQPYVRFVPLHEVVDAHVELGHTEWIILKLDNDRIRVIDEKHDTVYVKESGEYRLATTESGETDRVDNAFGMVPFIQASQYRNNVHSNFLKNSPISNVIPNLNYYQSISDDHVLTRKLHSNPLFYSYPVTCPTCNGSKNEKYYSEDDQYKRTPLTRTCSSCTGVGVVPHYKRDVSQGITLPITENMEREGFPAAAPPAGYVQIDSVSIDKQVEGLEIEERKIEKGALGTDGLLTAMPRERTATEVDNNTQPLQDTLASFSHNAEVVEGFITDCFGRVMFDGDWDGSYVHYGRKYFLRSEQFVMDEFEKSKKGGAPESYLRELLEELFYVRFENNPKALIRAMILLDLEPYPARNSAEEVILASPYCSEETLKVKFNFNDFVERFEYENGPIVAYGAEKDYKQKISEIKTKLLQYAKEIQPKPVSGNPDPIQQ